MLSFLPSIVVGLLAWVFVILNTLCCGSVLLIISLFRLLLPFTATRRIIDPILNGIAEFWVQMNGAWMRLLHNTQWLVSGDEKLRYGGWYLVNSNHQTWVDILVLQKIFCKRIPFLKFFLKKELIFVPFIGLVWWALDFPFMKRYNEAYLKKHPEKRGTDLITTRKACEKFSLVPTSVINFLEGTRFTTAKHEKQSSPYRHLLRPKAGGIALALNAMGDRFQSFVDVTIYYPGGVPTFWDLLRGRVGQIVVTIDEKPIPAHLVHGDYAGDPAFRAQVQAWVHALWVEKDAKLDALRVQYGKTGG